MAKIHVPDSSKVIFRTMRAFTPRCHIQNLTISYVSIGICSTLQCF